MRSHLSVRTRRTVKAVLTAAMTSTSQLGDFAWLAGAKRGVVRRYQPVFGEAATHTDRACADRWEAISAFTSMSGRSVLDIGSQIGYFSFAAAGCGATVVGIERDRGATRIAEAIRNRHLIPRVAFITAELTPESVLGLPKFDVCLCLSIYHHWVREFGFDTADRLLSNLTEKCDTLIFETGQPDEKNVDWAAKLAFMTSDVACWLESYLRNKGFRAVTPLGEFPTHLSATRRYLFAATKR